MLKEKVKNPLVRTMMKMTIMNRYVSKHDVDDCLWFLCIQMDFEGDEDDEGDDDDDEDDDEDDDDEGDSDEEDEKSIKKTVAKMVSGVKAVSSELFELIPLTCISVEQSRWKESRRRR